MKVICGNFKNSILRDSDDFPDEPFKAVLQLTLSHDATTLDGSEVESRIDIPLDENGAIPPGTKIIANDELKPRGTYYKVSVHDEVRGYRYDENLKIEGSSPIDLNALAPLGNYPDGPEPEPQPVAPPLPSKHVTGANYSGFFGGVIYPCGEGDYISIGEREERYPFYLPFKAVVRRASILVGVPCVGRSLLVGLHDAAGKKRLSGAIDASNQGVATAFLDETVTLNQGEYFLSWNSNSFSPDLKIRSITNVGLHGKSVIGPMVYFSA